MNRANDEGKTKAGLGEKRGKWRVVLAEDAPEGAPCAPAYDELEMKQGAGPRTIRGCGQVVVVRARNKRKVRLLPPLLPPFDAH